MASESLILANGVGLALESSDSDLVAEVAHDAAADAGEPDMADVRHQPSPHPHRREQPHHLLAGNQAVPLAPARHRRRGALHVGHREAAGSDLVVLLVRRRRVALDGVGLLAATHQARRPVGPPTPRPLRRAGARLEPAAAGDGGAADLSVGGFVEPRGIERAGAGRLETGGRGGGGRRVYGPAEREARCSFRNGVRVRWW